MREAVTTSVRSIELREAAEPAPPDSGEVLLDIASVRICGSDIGMWAGHDPYSTFPNRQGHEFSGRIAAFGDGYAGPLTLDQLVAVEPLLPDGTCIACRRGRPNCCVALRVYGAICRGPSLIGSWCRSPTSIRWAIYPRTSPRSSSRSRSGSRWWTRSGLRAGDQAVVFGAGPIGQAALLAAGDRGARLLAVDVVAGRLERARENGAEALVNASAEDVGAAVAAWTDGEGPTAVFEATGVAAVMRTAIEVAAHAGTVVVAGTSTEDVSIPSLALVRKELNSLGSRNSVGVFDAAVDLVRRHRERCEALITQRFGLADVQEALAFGEAQPTLSNKMMIVIEA